jgi:signal transduction histidine kinase
MDGAILLTGLTMAGLATAVVGVARRRARRARVLHAENARLRDDLDRCQRSLARRDRLSAIGMLAASVAHEVRNPLVSVRTFVQLLPERLHDEEFRTSFRELALAEIDRISLLVNDLLAFSRPAAPERHDADINDILCQIRRLVDGETKKAGIQVCIDLDPALPLLAVDEGQIKQVFLNLVLNAVQACVGGGTLTLATRECLGGATPYFQVEVRDSGRGIAPHDLQRVFEPFYTTREGGSGLGLFIVRGIVEDHGGFVEVHSAPGAGAVFFVNFPLPEAPADRAAHATPGVADADDHRAHRAVPNG